MKRMAHTMATRLHSSLYFCALYFTSFLLHTTSVHTLSLFHSRRRVLTLFTLPSLLFTYKAPASVSPTGSRKTSVQRG